MSGDAELALLADLFRPLRRLGPGSRATTLRALALLPPVDPHARIVEMGSGTGTAAAILAEATGAEVVALDLLPALLPRPRGSVLPVAGDMARPPFAPGSIDVVWSAASAYAVGFAAALAAWTSLLRAGGHLVVSDAVWRTPSPPAAASDFWAREYPGMTDAAARRAEIAAADGLHLVGDFEQPASDWAGYYGEVEARLPGFLADHPGDATARALAEGLRDEAAMWRRHGDAWAYHLFVARRRG